MMHSKNTLARRLKLQQLAIFDKVLELGTILAASRELHMTQPAVSKSIRELEGHLGQSLFTRSNGGVCPTAFGVLLQRHSRSLLGDLRILADDMNAWNSGVAGKVVVGTLITGSTLLPMAVMRLRETAPNVSVEVRVGSNTALLSELGCGHVDVVVGILFAEDLGSSITHVGLYDETLCVMVGRQHPLVVETEIDVLDLHELTWIVPTSESPGRPLVQQYFDAAGIGMPKSIVESDSILTTVGLLLESSMVTLMPRGVVEQYMRFGLLIMLPMGVLVPLGRVGYSLCADRTPTVATQKMLLALDEAGATLRTQMDVRTVET